LPSCNGWRLIFGRKRAEKLRELREGNFFGAGFWREFAGVERSGDLRVSEKILQVVPQRFSFLRKAILQKFQECSVVADLQACAFAGQMHRDESGIYFWRRTKRAGRNSQDNFGMREILAESGEIGVLAVAGRCDDARGDFILNDNVDGVNLRGEAEQMRENRRSDVVGQITVDAEACASERRQIDSENVGFDDFDVGPFGGGAFAESGCESGVGFDGDDAARALREKFGHFAVAGADLEPGSVRVRRKRARNAFAPRGAVKEVLAKLLAGHEKTLEPYRWMGFSQGFTLPRRIFI
jgi:hypothetical protein